MHFLLLKSANTLSTESPLVAMVSVPLEIIAIISNHKCKTKRIVYGLTCENGNQIFVDQTSGELHEKFSEHRAAIMKRQPCPVSNHFNNVCPNMDYLKITL